MKKVNDRSLLRTTLGLTQEEFAMLFKIPISLIAMYETNKRDLPSKVSVEMMQLYAYVLEKQKQEFVSPNLKTENAKVVSFLEKEIQINEALQWKYAKKIENMKAKYEKAKANLYLAEYFETKEVVSNKPSNNHAMFLHTLAKEKFKKNGPLAQMKYKVQLETLKWQHNHLFEELKKIKE